VGDPVLCEQFFDVIDAAAAQGINSIHVETDLIEVAPERVARLARGPVEVVSVHLPATTPQTYATVMGVDAYQAVLGNLQRFVAERQAARGRVPLLVPVFVKCKANLAETEGWYDQWLRAVGSAVIAGPSDFAGQIPDAAVADMAPARRSACARLASRMAVLSDGRVVSCEQDVLGRHPLGEVGKQSLTQIWQRSIGALRTDHQQGNWAKHELCAGCREWHRP
jgi:radical SAM protein with 4Fe4S-binding SPASM domain